MAKAKKTDKLDLYKQFKHEYAAAKKPVLVDVGPAQYLTIQGRGAPEGEAFTAAIGGLYAASFTIKMTWKFAGKGDYKVCHLEGLWWSDAMGKGVSWMEIPRSQWQWKLLIRVPDFIGAGELARAREQISDKGKSPQAARVQVERIEEGTCVQMLHVGPYATEPETIARMDALSQATGHCFRGPHHEIYLSDPRRLEPERLRTILRHPVTKNGA